MFMFINSEETCEAHTRISSMLGHLLQQEQQQLNIIVDKRKEIIYRAAALQPLEEEKLNISQDVDMEMTKIDLQISAAEEEEADDDDVESIGRVRTTHNNNNIVDENDDVVAAARRRRRRRKNVRISKDPQTRAARLRRRRISARVQMLQELVPGGNNMDTASMLHEAAAYISFLKSQVTTKLQQLLNVTLINVASAAPSTSGTPQLFPNNVINYNHTHNDLHPAPGLTTSTAHAAHTDLRGMDHNNNYDPLHHQLMRHNIPTYSDPLSIWTSRSCFSNFNAGGADHVQNYNQICKTSTTESHLHLQTAKSTFVNLDQ